MADSKFSNPSSSTSPPPNCAICLGSCSNKCFSDTCMHQFCFKCLLQWSKIKAECPLCKQPFKSIIHNVKSNEEYEEHIVEEPRPLHIIDNEQYLYLPQSPPNPSRQHRFHFRTTFTVNTHGENAIQQMLLSHSLTNGISISNYMPGTWAQHSRRFRRDISTTTGFRRSIYNNNLWASAPADVSGIYREVTPEYFQANPASRTRLAPWLNRELNALLYENTQDVMQLVDTIMDYLLRYHICSRSFRNLLQTYLGERTDHFVHEFYNFMRSPFDMIGYDRHVIYMERPSTPTFIDISEDDSSDVMIVEENPVVIEVSSSNFDDDVIMTSFPSEMPKPQMLPVIKKSNKRSRHIELDSSSSGSSSDREQKRREERSKRRKKRKITHVKHNKKQLKLAQFVMDASSSSELDDIPLAKYIRIKASIGKKILKKSSCLSKLKTRKSREHRSTLYKKNNFTSQGKQSLPKLIDLASTSSSRPYSNHSPSRRDSSSSSSSSSSATSVQTRPSKNIDLSTTSITSSNTPPLSSRERKKLREQQLDIPSCSRSTNDYAGGETRNVYYKHHNPSKREHNGSAITCSGPSRDIWLEGPSTSGTRGKSKQKSLKRELQSSTLQVKSQVSDSNRQDSNSDTPLELTNHCRYSPASNMRIPLGHVPIVPSPMLFNINPNMPRNPVVSQSMNFYNSSESPDLIDLSIAKFKYDNVKHDPYLSGGNSSTFRPNSVQMDILSGENGMTPVMEANQLYCASTSRQCFSGQTSSAHSFLPKREPKTETLAPEYNVESSNRYWTDFAAHNPCLSSSNDSSSYNFSEQHPRKSVIQNFANNRDYFISYNNSISPKWSSSNSPPFPYKPDCWSESSN